MKSHIHPIHKSIKYALSGITEAFREEPNLRIHFAVTSLVFVAGLIFQISKTEWLFIVFAVFLVLILELLNTSLEELTDLASPQIHPKAKLAKDVAAGAVLLSAINAVLIGLIIFLPKLLTLGKLL